MSKRAASFKDDPNSILSYQRHTQAMRQYLSAVPKAPAPPTKKVSAPRKKRERVYYRRLTWIARSFPLVIAIACLGILWDSEQRAGEYRRLAMAAALPQSSVQSALGRTASTLPAIDNSLSQTSEPGRERAFASPRIPLPSHAILLRDSASLAIRSDDTPAMMSSFTH